MKIIRENESNGDIEEIPEIRKYFARIFTVLSKEIKQKLKELNLSNDKKKKIKQELAFLPEEKQKEYLDELM